MKYDITKILLETPNLDPRRGAAYADSGGGNRARVLSADARERADAEAENFADRGRCNFRARADVPDSGADRTAPALPRSMVLRNWRVGRADDPSRFLVRPQPAA